MDPNVEAEEDEVADKLNKEFKISLPGQNLPTPARLIAFFTLIGGLSIAGSLFVDIVRPNGEHVGLFALRILAGGIAILTAYGIIEHKRWSIWLYGLFTLFALFSNPFLAIIPLGVVIYLYTQRRYFDMSIADQYLSNLLNIITNRLKVIKSDDVPPDGLVK